MQAQEVQHCCKLMQVFFSGSYLSDLIGRNLFLFMNAILTCLKFLVVFHDIVLGPYNFFLYKSVVVRNTYACKKLKFYLFANDTNIYCESNDLANLTKK